MDRQMKVVVVDDDRTNLMLVEMLVGKFLNCQVMPFLSARQALAGLIDQDFDAAIVDYKMPEMDGVAFINELRKNPRHADKPIVMVTVDKASDVKLAALDAGAVEFLQKPIEPIEFRVRMRNILRLAEAQRNLADRAAWLNEEIDKATVSLRWREEEIIRRLTNAASFKDKETGLHTVRMAHYCTVLAHQLGQDHEYCRNIQLAAPMHDIGKVAIRDAVLSKAGALTDDEWAEMKTHTQIGGEILADSKCELLQLAAEIALTHHERWDGKGYPRGLSGNEIPLSGRIAAVADVFDALTTERPYKQAWSMDRALRYLEEEAGQQFDPDCVRAFMLCRNEVENIFASHSEASAVAA